VRSHNPMLPCLRLMWEEGWVHFISTAHRSVIGVLLVLIMLRSSLWCIVQCDRSAASVYQQSIEPR